MCNVKVFVHGIDHNDLVPAGQKHRTHLHLAEKGLARSGDTENKTVAVDQFLAVTDIDVPAHLIDPVIDPPSVIQLLHIKGHQHGKGLCEHGAHGLHLPHAYGQRCVERLPLL